MTIEAIRLNDQTRFDDTVDVVVVGLGAAGASAAIEAQSAGAKVLVLERASAGGGSTAYSGGFIYLGGGTRVQKLNGIEDSAEEMYKYLLAVTPEPDETKIRLYAENSVEHFDWIEAQGARFNDGFYPHKHFEHATDESLAWTGNEWVWPLFEKAKPAPRGHKLCLETGPTKVGVGEAGGGGRFLMERLIARAEALGAQIVCDANAKQLVVDATGRIVGVRYTHFQEERTVRARKGVVLASGGFSMNPEMLQEYAPEFADERIQKIGSTYVDGAGHLMGESVGGVFVHMDAFFVTCPFYPPESLLKGILVNSAGKRFVSEDSYHSRSSIAILRQPESKAYLIVDNATFGRPEFPHDLIDAWESVAEMERGLSLPEGSLQETLQAYNRHAAHGEDPEFHKYKKWIQPLVEPPFAAFDCTVGHAPYMGFTLGGLKTSERGEVLDRGGKPIPGLYAAGQCASNLAQDCTGYATGTCIGESTFFGRQCGKAVAAQNS